MTIKEPKLEKVKSRKVNAYVKAVVRLHLLTRILRETNGDVNLRYTTLNGGQLYEASRILAKGGF